MPIGSPNVMFALTGLACYSPRIAAVDTVQGDYAVFDAAQWFPDRYDDPRYKVPECMIIWGYNIPATCPDNVFGHWIIDLMKKGRRSSASIPGCPGSPRGPSIGCSSRPGTDGALAMGFLNVIINEDLYDNEFLERWTNGAHLIRKDTGKLLREDDLADDGFPRTISWRGTLETAGRSSGTRPRSPTAERQASPAHDSGAMEVALTDGDSVRCHTAWDAFRREVDTYPPGAGRRHHLGHGRGYRASGPALREEQAGRDPLGRGR